MPAFSFGTSAGGDTYAPTPSAGQLALAAQTTLNALTTVLVSSVAAIAQTAVVAVALPLNQPAGQPIVVTNTGATNAVSVFPPWNALLAVPAAAGGRIFGASATLPTINAAVLVGTGRTVLFYAHANGIDYTAVWGAVA